MQRAIAEAITRDLRHIDENLEASAIEAWDRLMMVILEMLARAYGNEAVGIGAGALHLTYFVWQTVRCRLPSKKNRGSFQPR